MPPAVPGAASSRPLATPARASPMMEKSDPKVAVAYKSTSGTYSFNAPIHNNTSTSQHRAVYSTLDCELDAFGFTEDDLDPWSGPTSGRIQNAIKSMDLELSTPPYNYSNNYVPNNNLHNSSKCTSSLDTLGDAFEILDGVITSVCGPWSRPPEGLDDIHWRLPQ